MPIKFYGCSFTNSSSSYVGSAINTHNSGLTVGEYCSMYNIANCNCHGTSIRSSFNGFGTAINVNTTGSQCDISIDRSDFSNNSIAVSIHGANNTSILRSTFDISDQGAYGLMIQNSTGYKIEGNDFYCSIYTSTENKDAIYIYGSGVAENSVYRNTFTKGRSAIYVGGINGSTDLTDPGLQITCNQFNGNHRGLFSPASLIRSRQGEAAKGADNDFINVATWGIYSQQPFNYFYSNQSDHIPPNYASQPFYLVSATANNCASTLCGTTIIVKMPFTKNQINPLNQYDQLSEDLSQLKSQYNNIANESFSNGRPSNAADSETALVSSELLVENISDLSLQLNNISQNAIPKILQDSIVDLSQLAEWYSRMPAVSADYSLVETYFQKGEYMIADQILASMLSDPQYDAIQLIDHQNYSRVHTLKNTLQQSNRYWDELTEKEIDELISIAIASNERSSSMAKGVLCFFYNICFENELEDESGLVAPRSHFSEDISFENTDIQVFPNPVEDNLTVFVPELPEGAITIQLFDAMGRSLFTQSITDHYSTINLSMLSQGLYYYMVFNNNNISIGRGKVVKQ